MAIHRYGEYEVVIEYEPDPKDSFTTYTKILDVPPEDFDTSTFYIIALPDIPSSAISKKKYERRAHLCQWEILGSNVVIFSSIACWDYLHLGNS